MPVGLAIPVGIGVNGGVRMSMGSENDTKIIRTAMGDDTNENAFQQDIGIGVGAVFDASDGLTQAKIMSRLRSVFRRFEAQKRFRLLETSINWRRGEDGEMILEFNYINLEADDARLFSMPYKFEK